MKGKGVAVFAVMFCALGIAHGETYEAMANLPDSASNMILNNMVSGYDIRDYTLFETCAERVLDMDMDTSLEVFKKIFEQGEPSANIHNPVLEAELRPYFYVSVLAMGRLGGDNEALMLYNTLLNNDDVYISYYVIRAMGYLVDVDLALDTLNEAAGWVDSHILAVELLNALKLHGSMTSMIPLTEMYKNPQFKDLQTEIMEVVTHISNEED